MKKILIFASLLSPVLFAGCSGTTNPSENMTVAKAQRELKIGMSSSDVVSVLGSPNMVTTDDQRRETWVYDRVSQSSSSKGTGLNLIVFNTGKNSTTSSSKTLTIIVKFDENSKVRDFSYRTSSF